MILLSYFLLFVCVAFSAIAEIRGTMTPLGIMAFITMGFLLGILAGKEFCDEETDKKRRF